MKVREIAGLPEWLGERRRGFNPKLSVLMPTYRRGADGLFLQAARSVLNQTLYDLELIIVDDASTDGTADIIEQLRASDHRVFSMRHPFNIGLPAISEYEAYCQARAEYIAFAFDDFLFEKDAFSLLLQHMRYAGAKVAHGQIIIKDQEGKDHSFGRCDRMHERLTLHNFLGNASFVVHRSVIESVGLYDPHIGLSRVCDWDLWIRIHRLYPILVAPVAVGRELGLSRKDSLGNTYPMHFEVMQEMMAPDRTELLLPQNFLDRDFTAIPPGASYALERHILEAVSFFSSKEWVKQKSVHLHIGSKDNEIQMSEVRAPVVSIFGELNASNSLYWKCSTNDILRYLNFIEPSGFCSYENMQLLRSDVVIFVREIFSERQSSALSLCRKVGIPHFYFLDDNFSVLASESPEYNHYRCENLRNELGSFSGVIVSSSQLQRFFHDNNLHKAVQLVRPVFDETLYRRCKENHFGPAPLSSNSICFAFFGGSFRLKSLQEDVLPAIELFGKGSKLLMRASPEEVQTDTAVEIIDMEYTPYLSAFLEEWVEYRPLAVVHPRGQTANIDYKSSNAILIACYLGAVPVVCNERAYDGISESEGIIKVTGGSDSWRYAFMRLKDPGFRKMMLHRLDEFCRKNFDASVNAAVIKSLIRDIEPLDSHRAVGRFKQAFLEAESRYTLIAGQHR
jgi:hypothetical protein